MRDQPTASTPTVSSDAPPGADDWARALLDRQLQMLSELAEGGLLIARAIQRQATDAAPGDGEPSAVVQGDISLAHARVARAVRQTLMLQSKVIEERRALDAARAAQDRQVSDAAGARDPRTARIIRTVRHAAEAERGEGLEVERLVREAAERLERDDIYTDAASRPVSDLIVQICADLGLQPDWPRLAEEALAEADRTRAELDSKTEHIVFSWRDPEPVAPTPERQGDAPSSQGWALDRGDDSS